MENGDFLSTANQAFADYGLAMLLAVLVLGAITAFWLYQRQNSQQRDLQREMQALRFQIDDQHMHTDDQRMQPRGPSLTATPDRGPQRPPMLPASPAATPPPVAQGPVNRMQAELELQAYQKIWPSVRDLHDKLGNFLRAIETGDTHEDSRKAARAAALKAKDCAQRLRPFYPENIEALIFQLIDNEVHMHLSACAYLDNNDEPQTKAAREKSNSAYQSLRDESKLIYDGECRQQLNILVQSIRQRLANQQVVE